MGGGGGSLRATIDKTCSNCAAPGNASLADQHRGRCTSMHLIFYSLDRSNTVLIRVYCHAAHFSFYLAFYLTVFMVRSPCLLCCIRLLRWRESCGLFRFTLGGICNRRIMSLILAYCSDAVIDCIFKIDIWDRIILENYHIWKCTKIYFTYIIDFPIYKYFRMRYFLRITLVLREILGMFFVAALNCSKTS